MEHIYKFNEETKTTLSDLKDTRAYKLREKLNNGGKLTSEEENYITLKCNESISYKDTICYMGWAFYFGDVLHKYVIEDCENDFIQFKYAMSLSALAKLYSDEVYDWDNIYVAEIANMASLSELMNN